MPAPQGYIPAWILVLIVGVACFARHRRAPILLFVIAAALFLTAAFFTRPKEDNVVTVRFRGVAAEGGRRGGSRISAAHAKWTSGEAPSMPQSPLP